jgi:hypothetical protein
MDNMRPVFINAQNFTPQYSGIVFSPSQKDTYLIGQCFSIWLVMVNIEMAHNETGLEDVDWIGLSKDRDKWRSTVYMVLNVPVSKMQLIYQLAQQMLSSLECGLMQSVT